MSKKTQTLELLFDHCKKRGDYIFHNDLVKELSKKTGFGNPFDVTKIDQSRKLPAVLSEQGYCVVHLGQGRHEFVKAADVWYHEFEEIAERERIDLKYRPSILNHTDTSESNIISFAYNQRVLIDFLYKDEQPKIYLPRRTTIDADYLIKAKSGTHHVKADKLQMEIDAVFERDGRVTIIEGKNGFHKDFAVYQLFHPFLYYANSGIEKIKTLDCCYLLKKKRGQSHILRLYLYRFTDKNDLSSIKLEKKAEYTLESRDKV